MPPSELRAKNEQFACPNTARACALAIVLLGSVAPTAAVESFAPDEAYRVKPGDTLWDISRHRLGRPLLWPSVQKKNKLAEPRSLQIGRVLHFGERQAIVLAATGSVRLEDVGADTTLTPGHRVPELSVIKTGPDSFVTLKLPDGSTTTLPSNSTAKLVRFFNQSGHTAALIDLENGEVESRVRRRDSPTDPEPLRVRTRLATIGVRGTHFRVRLPDPETTAVGVLESSVAVETRSRQAQLVPTGKGILEGAGPLAGALQDLLPAPQWVKPSKSHERLAVSLEWLGVAGAASYRVQIARDKTFIDVISEKNVSAAEERHVASFDAIPPGSYFARVGAVTQEGVEGLVSEVPFLRSPARLQGSASQTGSGEVEFTWDSVQGGVYRLEVADDNEFKRLVVDASGIESSTVRINALPPGSYWWRVTSEVAQGQRRVAVQSNAAMVVVAGAR